MIKLIIVDDEKSTREGLAEFIPWNSLGVSIVECAGSGDEALKLAEQIRPDIILSDIKMPGMNGIEFAVLVKAILPDCKFIFLSGYADKEYLKSAIQLRAINYLEKPVNREEVKRAVSLAVHAVMDEQVKNAESNAILKEKLALDMAGMRTPFPDILQRLQQINKDILSHGNVITAIIKIDILSDPTVDMEHNQHNHKQLIHKAIDLVFNNPVMYHLAGFKDNQHLVIHFYGKGISHRDFPSTIISSLKKTIEELASVKVDLFMGIGIKVDGLKQVRESYRTAALALQKQFFIGANQMVIYENRVDNGQSYRLDAVVIKQFIDCLNECDKDKTLRFIIQMHDEIRRHTELPIKQVKDIFCSMLLELNAFATGYNIDPFEKQEHVYFWDIFTSMSSLTEIQNYMLDRISVVFDNIHSKNSIGQNVFMIMQVIQEHYHDDHLTINMLAKHLFLTPTYLCMIFKKKTGKTINQYITEVRIEKAKEFLKEERVKLLEISRKVGYQSPNHFTKIFKKMTGMNPSDYRERHYL
ncbi:response regulator [Paenibacillus qinlingensis]|uniref:response regulator n=1 Tax=Paenibacillus qinlingensis TaxID=1837343 RepID=UPI001565942A|nr:response regulator [Paenibacillus qinlingensis]NQX57892.1 response regulator [Paenibacillus qinlingensis]